MLLGSGLRISEVLQLDRDQYTGKGFTRVQVKGGQLRDFIPVQRDARAVLEEWLKQRGDAPGPLFPTRSNRRLSRREAALIMQRIAGQANANLYSAIIGSLCRKRVGVQPTRTEVGAKQHWTGDSRAGIIARDNNPYLRRTPWR